MCCPSSTKRTWESAYLVEHDPEARKLMSPLTILEGPRETFIEILHRPDRELVTVLELLSPSNKEQPGRTEYLAKRRALLVQKTHLVELDLLRAGRRMPSLVPLPSADYCYLVARGERRPDAEVFSWSVRNPLPTLPVPLLAPDPDVYCDLGAVFKTTYDRGRVARKINYAVSLSNLRPEDQQWAAQIVRSA